MTHVEKRQRLAELEAERTELRAAMTPAEREHHDRDAASLQAVIDDLDREIRAHT